MHFNHLGRMTYGQAGIRAAKTGAFLLQQSLVADENDLDIRFSDSLKRSLDAGNGTMVSSHRIKRNLHTG